jgi:hypothetical protein
LFTAHKLLGLAAIILTAVVCWKLVHIHRSTALILTLMVFLGLSILGIFVSGALLSQDKSRSNFMLRIHNLASLLALVLAIMTVYLLV